MMCTNDAFYDFLCCMAMHCDKCINVHLFVEEKALPDLCFMLLYSTVTRLNNLLCLGLSN